MESAAPEKGQTQLSLSRACGALHILSNKPKVQQCTVSVALFKIHAELLDRND